jgi:hypothetical protein
MPALREAAYAGVGVVQLPMMMIWEDLAAGRLVEVLQGWHPPAGIVHATFASRRGCCRRCERYWIFSPANARRNEYRQIGRLGAATWRRAMPSPRRVQASEEPNPRAPLREREHVRNRPTRLLRPIRLRRIADGNEECRDLIIAETKLT